MEAIKEHRKIYDAFVKRGIYLTKYYLLKVLKDKEKGLLNNVETYLKFNSKLLKLTHIDNGAYSTNPQKPRIAVVATNITNGKKTSYNSIYEAANTLKIGTGYGNISKALKSGAVMYGCIWTYKNKK